MWDYQSQTSMKCYLRLHSEIRFIKQPDSLPAWFKTSKKSSKDEVYSLSTHASAFHVHLQLPVPDPGFPVGGCGPRRGAWTPEVAVFHKICMSKWKNWVPWGGRTPGTPPRIRQWLLFISDKFDQLHKRSRPITSHVSWRMGCYWPSSQEIRDILPLLQSTTSKN